MVKKKALPPKTVEHLESTIANLYPSLERDEIEDIKLRILNYVSDGLNQGYDIALIKKGSKEDLVLKVLRIRESHE